jgi:predicted enzyme related to lactoylglutathione lyase
MLEDPDGLLVGLQRVGASLGRPSDGGGAAVDWFEVLGADAGRSQAFYAELFGWAVPEGAYGLVAAGAEHGIGGGIGAGGEARWATVYASVADVEATLAKAESLGASRVYGPNPVDDHTETGAFRDPAGNVFGVYHHGQH